MRWLFRVPAQFLGILLFLAVGASDVAAGVLTPAPGTKITTSSVTVSWQSEPGATGYMLGVGTSQKVLTAGSKADISFQATGLKTSADVFGIPLNGKTVYMRLWTQIASRWKYKDYTYTTAAGSQDRPAEITTPLASQTLSIGTVLQWSGRGTSEYMLAAGTSMASISPPLYGDLYFYKGTDNAHGIPWIPQDGSTVYIRLWSKILSRWFYKDYQYSTYRVVPAQITAPASGTNLQKHAQRVEWTSVEGATQYVLTIAREPGLLVNPQENPEEYIFSGSTQDTSLVATGIPLDGAPVYMRIWSQVSGLWYYSDSSYSSIFSSDPPDPEAECIERRWEKVSLDVQGQQRNLLWRAPREGVWNRGAIIMFHGGGGSSSNWCSAGLTYDQLKFAEAAIDEGFAVFSPNATGFFLDPTGFPCVTRFDAQSPSGVNKDIAYIEKLLSSTISGLRPAGSSNKVFMTGISSGGFMTLRAATHFDSRIAGFASVSAGDPYGTYMNCLGPQDEGFVTAATTDRETGQSVSVVDACLATDYPHEMAWETENPATRAAFKLLHHKNDGLVDFSCMEKAKRQLISHGYTDRGAFVLDNDDPRDVAAHLWQPEYGPEILEFFKTISGE